MKFYFVPNEQEGEPEFFSEENQRLLSDMFNQKFNDQIVYHYKQPPPDFVGGVTRYKINFISRTVVNIDKRYGPNTYDLKMV
jgi:hypothetical protein